MKSSCKRSVDGSVYGRTVMMGVEVTFQVVSPAERSHQGSGTGSLDLTSDFDAWTALPFRLLLLDSYRGPRLHLRRLGSLLQIFGHDLPSQSVFSRNLCLHHHFRVMFA